ncbi:DUF2750 domain-containing protein [Salinisphaera sp. P385]|uniref:DUF2750 domain-containing protein n=1 Tax=Spectribacter acetivorans TaxID=3075603 RepID=A0ABU3BDD9_9GAMM|nr:DUF2750 domain-containing protein [Salinisphaera sp. P385]MDT0619862.1 DUF2750 domain-containing protein [Salinisphaera sp. P385]
MNNEHALALAQHSLEHAGMAPPEDAQVRAERFLREAADSRQVWGLSDGAGWASSGDEASPTVPLWSQHHEAEAALPNFPDFAVAALDLDTLVLDVLPALAQFGCWVGANLTPELGGLEFDPEEMRDALKDNRDG